MIRSLVPGPGGWIAGTTCGVFLTLEAIIAPGRTGRVAAVLRYDARDPYAVRLECHPPNGTSTTWHFARETLEAGLRGRAGRGSVLVCTGFGTRDPHTYILLNNHETHCVLRSETRVVRNFLTCSKRLVPYGEERRHVNLDALIASCDPAPEP